jgi:hypothetical protein
MVAQLQLLHRGSRIKRVGVRAPNWRTNLEEHKDGPDALGHGRLARCPRSVTSLHPSRAESDAQLVEITFSPEGEGTRVDLVSTGWEKMSDKARATRGGYQLGWGLVLNRFAGRFTPLLLFFGAMSAGITLIGQRGKFVRTSLGKMDD